MSSVMGMTGKLGDILLSLGWIGREDLQKASSDEHRVPGERFGAALLRLGLITDDRLREALAMQYGLPFMHVNWRLVDQEILETVPKAFVQKHRVVPMFRWRPSLKSISPKHLLSSSVTTELRSFALELNR